MPSLAKRPQVRTCSACKKTGHNAGTCLAKDTPTMKASAPPETSSPRPAPPHSLKPAPAPVRFFVHHVPFESKQSPHVVDLKKQSFNVWDTVEAAAPEKISRPVEHLFAERRPIQNAPTSAPPEISTPVSVFTESIEPQPAPSKKTLLEPTGIISKKSITINVPTVHLSALGKKIRLATQDHYETAKERAGKQLTAWRVNEQKKSAFSPLSLPAAEPEKPEVQPTTPPREAPLTKLRRAFTIPSFLRDTDPWRKRLAGALAALLILSILPLQAKSYYQTLQTTKTTIANKSTDGFLALQESTGALLNAHLGEAQEGTVRALQNFASAVDLLDDHRLLQKLVSVVPVLGDQVSSRQELILAGQEISLGNTYLIKGVDESLQGSKQNLLDKLTAIVLHVRSALPHYQKARLSLEKVDPGSLPVEYQTTFKDFQKIFISATHDFEQLADLGSVLQDLFGGQGLRRYLLVFQNPAEIRATGGFIGSYAEVDIKDGAIVRFEVPAGGSYDVQGQLRKYIEPPTPLLMANKRWEFQDANWFPDFPASAEKLLWFYRNSDRGSVDGIIALNATVLERLLSIVGPVTDATRGVTLDKVSALTTLQSIVEEGDEKKAKKPKQVLGDFSHLFLNYFSSISPQNLLPLLVNLKEALDEKEVQVYLADPTYQDKIAGFGWSGAVVPSSAEQDYLLVINSNILGEKSDAKIKQSISHQAVVQPDGTITDTVTITREHTGTPGEKFYGKPNIDYVRLYVPKGSELLEAKGFSWPDEKNFRAPDAWTKRDETLNTLEHVVLIDDKTGTRITEEFGKFAFGNWMVTEPGKITQVQVTYRLPFTLENLSKKTAPDQSFLTGLFGSSVPVSTYQLIVQKQSGVRSAFDSTIIFPAAWVPVWKDGPELMVAKNGASITLPDLAKDSVWSLAMKKI